MLHSISFSFSLEFISENGKETVGVTQCLFNFKSDEVETTFPSINQMLCEEERHKKK